MGAQQSCFPFCELVTARARRCFRTRLKRSRASAEKQSSRSLRQRETPRNTPGSGLASLSPDSSRPQAGRKETEKEYGDAQGCELSDRPGDLCAPLLRRLARERGSGPEWER